jgi:hypothetical protein
MLGGLFGDGTEFPPTPAVPALTFVGKGLLSIYPRGKNGILLPGRPTILIRDFGCCICALFFFVLRLPAAYAQGTAPTFSHTIDQHAYTFLDVRMCP